MFSQIKFVTGNSNKVRETVAILGVPLEEVKVDGLIEIQTLDIEELVYHKCQQAYDSLKCSVLVEDSGLLFNAWGGLPGPLIKWFECTVGCEGMLKMLQTFEDRSAIAVSCFAIYDGKDIKIARGEVEGSIATEIRGSHGFGWDVIFVPKGYEKTYAEMKSEEKNTISHRKCLLKSNNLS